MKKLTRNLTENDIKRIKRCAIIPYFILNDEKYFMLAIDKNRGYLTDLGGNINNGEDFITSAIRELYEESLQIIDLRDNYDHVKNNSISYINGRYCIIFQPFSRINALKISLRFREKYLDPSSQELDPVFLENSYLIYISEKKLLKLIDGRDDIKLPNDLFKGLKSINKKHLKILNSEDNSSNYNTKHLTIITFYPPIYPIMLTLFQTAINIGSGLTEIN